MSQFPKLCVYFHFIRVFAIMTKAKSLYNTLGENFMKGASECRNHHP